MENKWITMLEEGTSPIDLLDKIHDAMQSIVDGGDMDERTRQVFDLIEMCRFIVTKKAQDATNKDFATYSAIFSLVLTLFEILELDPDDTDFGLMVWVMVQIGAQKRCVKIGKLVMAGVNHAIKEYSEEEQAQAKADLIIEIIEKDDPKDLILYKTIIDYYQAKNSTIESIVRQCFVPYVENCLNDEEEIAKIIENEDNEIAFSLVCESIMFLYEREKTYTKEETFLRNVMDKFKGKSDLVYYLMMCDLGRMIYVTSDGAKDAIAMKYFQESASHGISAAKDAIKMINDSKEYQNKYSKHIKMRNIFAIATAVIDVASIICFCVTTPIVGTILLLAVAGILASISLIFGVKAGEVKAKAENDQPKVNRQLGIRNIVSDLVGIPYYPLVIVGGVLVPLIFSSIMGFFLSSKY
ncbi:MAG: hypothetical protein ACI4MY_04975 [Christensenellales bacterium]